MNQKDYLNEQVPEWLNESEFERIYSSIQHLIQELKDQEQVRLNRLIDLEDQGSRESKYIRLMALDMILKEEGITKAQF